MIWKKALVLTLAATLVTTGCGKQTTAAQEKKILVRTAHPATAELTQTAAYTGRILPDEAAYIVGKGSGTVEEIFFEVGDRVEADAVLFQLDTSDALIEYNGAKVAYDAAMQQVQSSLNGAANAQTELQLKSAVTQAENALLAAKVSTDDLTTDNVNYSKFRAARSAYNKALREWEAAEKEGKPAAEREALYKTLAKRQQEYDDVVDDFGLPAGHYQAVSALERAYDGYDSAVEAYEIYQKQGRPEQLEGLELQRKAAELQFEGAQKKLDYMAVRSPIAGVVEAVNVQKNTMYSPSQGVAYVVSNPDLLTVVFSVSADVAANMQAGDAVTVEHGQRSFSAKVFEIGNAVNQQTGLFQIKAMLDEGAALPSGVAVKLIAITDKAENALTIPTAAIYYDAGASYVYIHSADGKAVKTPITLGIVTNQSAEVTAGLTAADEVITTWHPNLIDGVIVTVKGETPAADPA